MQVAHHRLDAAFLLFCASSVNQTLKIENDSELVALHEFVKTVPKARIL